MRKYKGPGTSSEKEKWKLPPQDDETHAKIAKYLCDHGCCQSELGHVVIRLPTVDAVDAVVLLIKALN